MGHVARKRFGQHFLTDPSVVARIVDAVAPRDVDRIVEIGPGLAALTDALLARVAHIVAIEIDRDLAARLRRRYGSRLELVEADALRVDFAALGEEAPLRVVGNLPYNISSPLLVHLLDARAHIADQHFMLQKEVVARIVASPGTSDYGRLGVLLQAYHDTESLFDVPPEAFDPPPRVWSSVVRLVPKAAPAQVAPAMLSQVLAAAFGQRRKMLRNTLLPWLAQRGLDAAGLAPTDRPEDVPVDVYVALADQLARRSISSIL